MQFFEHIYKDAPDGAHVVIVDTKGPGTKWNQRTAPLDELVQANGNLTTPDKHWFFTPAVLPAGKKRDKDSMLGSNVLWVDIDLRKQGIEYDPDNPLWYLPPSFIVDSGGGLHLYYLLDKFYSNGELEEMLAKIVKHVYLADTGVKDVARVMRMPNTVNIKYDDKPMATVIESHPDRVYSRETILKLGNAMVKTVAHKDDKSARQYGIILALLEWGFTDDEILQVLLGQCEKSREELHSGQPQRSIAKARRKLEDDAPPGMGSIKLAGDLKALPEPAKPDLVKTQPKGRKETDPFDGLINGLEMRAVGVLKRTDGTDAGAGILCELKFRGREGLVPMTLDDFRSVAALNTALKNWDGTLIYKSGDAIVRRLYEALVNQAYESGDEYFLSETFGRVETPQGPRYAISRDQMYTADGIEAGYVDVSMGEKVVQPELIWDLAPHPYGEWWDELIDLALEAQPEDFILPGLTWALGTVWKTLWLDRGKGYPHLLITGVAGSGKTAMARSLFMKVMSLYKSELSTSTTYYVAMRRSSQVASWPLWASEYRNGTSRDADKFKHMLRNSYDGSAVARGTANQETNTHDQYGSYLIDGEGQFDEPAVAERMFVLVPTDERKRRDRNVPYENLRVAPG
jgi:hypothetical protein